MSHSRGARGGLMYVVACALGVLLHASLCAQPVLRVNRVSADWRTIRVGFQFWCDGGTVVTLTDSLLGIVDSGHVVSSYTLDVPDPSGTSKISVGLVFDASGSMVGAYNQWMIRGGSSFVRELDGADDEASVHFFNSTVVDTLPMTSDTARMQAVIGSIPADKGTMVFDGTWAGLQEVLAHGRNATRAVISITDGGDGASEHGPYDLIRFASRHGIRVFTIALGLGGSSDQLRMIAEQTGGTYYATMVPDSLPAIYLDILRRLRYRCDEYVATFTSATQPDGLLHPVELAVTGVCGGHATGRGEYRAPLLTGITPLHGVVQEALRIEVFPKPSHGVLTIRLDGGDARVARVFVINSAGRIVRRVDDVPIGSALQHTIDLTGEPCGSYVIMAQSGLHRTFTKVTRY